MAKAAAILIALAPQSGATQSWPNLDQLLFSTLTVSGTAEASYWLPDAYDPTTATRAIGVVYEHIPGSAGNTGIALGYYARSAAGWQFLGRVEGVFGQQPRDVSYGPNWAEVTTLMPGPNDPRCCPTALTRWRIDLNSRQAARLP